MKILFVIASFRNGGTNTSLRNMVSMLPKNNLQLYVFAVTDEGPNKDFLSQYCTLLNPSGASSSSINTKSNVISHFAHYVKWVKKKLEKVGVDISPLVFKRVASGLQKQNFDLVVAFQEETATRFCSYFDKTRKIAWTRCDYSRYLSSPKIINLSRKIYTGFERIVCVSDYTCEQFLSVLPELKSKSTSLHNLINDSLIISRSKEKVTLPWNDKVFSIVSVGRFDKVKRFEYIPIIAKNLKDRGVHFKWAIIGGGNESINENVNKALSDYNVKDEVILLGEINNPYPFIANSNLLVCLSSTEACPNVVNEAKILHVPVVATNFGSVYEFLEDGYNGLITPIEQLGETIANVIVDNEKYNTLKNNIDSFKYDNEEIIGRLEKDIFKTE